MMTPVPQAAVDALRAAEEAHDVQWTGWNNIPAKWACLCGERFEGGEEGFAAKEAHRDESIAAAVVAAVQGPIKAEALRDAANAIEPTTCAVNRTCHESDAITLRIRAERIDPTNPPTE